MAERESARERKRCIQRLISTALSVETERARARERERERENLARISCAQGGGFVDLVRALQHNAHKHEHKHTHTHQLA